MLKWSFISVIDIVWLAWGWIYSLIYNSLEFFFKKLVPSLGVHGVPISKLIGKIFSKYVFLNLLSPLGLFIPPYALQLAQKTLKKTQGAVKVIFGLPV